MHVEFLSPSLVSSVVELEAQKIFHQQKDWTLATSLGSQNATSVEDPLSSTPTTDALYKMYEQQVVPSLLCTIGPACGYALGMRLTKSGGDWIAMQQQFLLYPDN